MKLRHYIAIALSACALGAIAEIVGVGATAATYGVYGVALIGMFALLRREPRVRPTRHAADRNRSH